MIEKLFYTLSIEHEGIIKPDRYKVCNNTEKHYVFRKTGHEYVPTQYL